jgi:probable F420-dependent oxidoreductase
MAAKDIDWGIHLPQLGRNVSRQGVIEGAQRAEELGFHSGWVSDHIVVPHHISSSYPYTDDGSFPAPADMPWLDPIGTLFFVAACTQRLKLGTTVLILGYRPPVLTAKAVASLDVLSEGRLILGVGVGWMKEEFDALGMPYDHRGARADEQLEVLDALFENEPAEHHGAYYDFAELGFEPKPTGHVPIWVGGDTEPAYQRTARVGDAFHAAFQSVDEVRAGWARVRELAAERGRNADDLQLSIRLYLDPTAAMTPSKSIAGSTEQMRDTIGRWAEIGVHHILLDPVAPGGPAGRLAAMEHFMTEVVPGLG